MEGKDGGEVKKTKLSIAMPSNRNVELSRKSIDCSLDYCHEKNLQLSVSDNSSCEEKKELWNGYQFYIPSKPCGMIENFYNAFDKTTGEFVLIMGDDDRIFSINEANFDVASDVVGIHPSIVAFTAKDGIVRGDATELNAETAIGRVKQYHAQCNGSNLAFFSFWRRDLLKSIMDLWFLHHPTMATYCDWAVMSALASSGKVIRDTSTVYFYDISNWMGGETFIKSQVEKAFVNSGLPKEAAQHSSIFQAIDSFIFINRQDNGLRPGEALIAAQHCIGDNFDWNAALEFVDGFGLKEKYQHFYLHATGKEWGEI